MLLDYRRPAVFRPADPLREGWLALYGEGHDEIELALPAGRTVRRKTVPARLVPIGDALPELLALPRDGTDPAWVTAATAGVGLVARGRLLPTATDAETLADGRVALGEFGAIRVWRNRITCRSVQLRLGPDCQWYRLARSGTGWNLDAAPDPDTAVLLTPDASTVTL